MPKTPIDYSKAIIYSIVCKTDETLLYIGSTTDFTKRKNKHKCSCINEKHRCHNCPVYVMIRATGGWDNFEMKPVKEYACENKIQLVIEEERIRKEMKANLNTIKAYRSAEERNEETKQYYQANKQQIAEREKQYYKKNKEQIAEAKKQHYEKNKEKTIDRAKQYYQANKQQISERNRTKRQELKNAL